MTIAAQLLAAVLLPAALARVAGRVTSALAGRRGAPLLQPLHDLRRALHKRPRTVDPRALLGLAAALAAALLAPLVAARSPFAFAGDLAVFTLLLAARRRLLAARPLAVAPALAVAALVLVGRDTSLSTPHLGAQALAWPVDALAAGALLLALRLHRADPPAPTGEPSELDALADRAGAAVVTAALAGALASRAHPSCVVQLALLLVVAAFLGAIDARAARPRPRSLPVLLALAAALAALAVALARGGL